MIISAGQGGQVDLGAMPIESVKQIEKTIGTNQQHLQPAKTYRYASTISILTHLLSKENKKLSTRTHISYGSFSTLSGNLGIKYSFGKKNKSYNHIAFNFNALNSKGNYPYQIPKSGNNKIYRRNNSHIFRYQTELGGRFSKKNNHFYISYLRNHSKQELPNAVVLYVFKNQQFIKKNNNQINYHSLHKIKKWTLKPNISYQHLHTEYTDSNILNTQGYIHDKYFFQSLHTSLAFNRFIHTKKDSTTKNIKLYGAIDYEFNTLNSNRTSIKNPTRHQALLLLGTRFLFPKINAKLDFNILSQGIFDSRKQNIKKKIWAFNPYIGFGINPSKKINLILRLFYKNSIRIPSFNDLYYTQIGNLNLKTEKAHQINTGISYSFIPTEQKTKQKIQLQKINLETDAFYNFVFDKIIAIPTKDLFIWSIINVGKAQIIGLDTKLNLQIKLYNKIKIYWNTNYTYQIALDKTSKTQPSYNHQLAYIPKHTLNTSIGLKFYGIGILWRFAFTSQRYHLNQNISSNLLPHFSYQDIDLSYTIIIKKDHQIKIIFSIGNITDQQYEIVRSFPMIRRNFKIKLIYAFN